MDFHGMKRKNLQAVCKKHGIPGNLKNIEMATRLASLFKKETVTETRILPEDSVESDGIKDDLVVSKEAKRVRFSPENEFFEFTRSGRNCQRRNVRMRSHGLVQDLQQELRQSKRSVAKEITVAGSAKNKSNTRRGGVSDVTKAIQVPRRSKRIGSSVSTQQDCKIAELKQFDFEDISDELKIGRRSTRLKANLLESCVGGGTLKAKTLLPAKRSQRLVDMGNKKDELFQSNVKDIVQDDPKREKVSRPSVNDIDVQTNSQDRRRSIRLKAKAANSSMGGETSDGRRRPFCSAKESKKETKTKQSKGSEAVNSQEGEFINNKTYEPLIYCEVQTTENCGGMKVQDVSRIEKVPLRSKRLRKDINVLMDKRPVKAVKREESLSELLADGQAQKGDKQSKRAFGSYREDKKLLQSSKLISLDSMSDSPKSCSVTDGEQDGASVDNVNDETQVRVRFTRNSSRHYSFEAPIIVEGNQVEKNTDETLEKAGGTNVGYGGSSNKPKTIIQECVKDVPQGMIENSPSSPETKAAETVMVIENVLASSPEKSVDSSQRTIITQELNSELMEGEREEKHEQDTVLVDAIKEKEETLSLSVLLIERSEVSNHEVELFVETTPPPASVQVEVSNHEVELGVPTAHILVKDIALTVIANEDIKTKEKIQSVAKLAEAEAILENSAEYWNEIHSSKDDEKGSLEKKMQAENLHGNFSEYNTENSKVGCITVGHSGNLESLDEVKDDSLEKTEQKTSCESDFKLNELELRRWSPTKEDNTVSKCFKEDEIKALSQHLPRNKDVTVFDESAIFTTPERNLMLMEHVSENGKTPAAESVTHHKDEAVESHVVVLTTSKQVLLLGDAGIDETGREEDDTSTNFPDESDAPNTTERYSMSEGSRQTEGESEVIELHDDSDIATLVNCKGDKIGRNEENRTVELQRESDTCTSSERHEFFGSFGQDKARESEGKKVVQFYEESGLSTGLHRDQPLAESELGKAGWQEINSADKSGLFTSLETQLLYGASEQKKAVKTGEKVDAEFHDASDVPNIPERHPFTEDAELDEAAKSEEDKAVELHVDCGIFTSAEKNLLLETDEEMKGDNMTTNSHVAPDVFIASESQSHMGGFEPDVDMNVDLVGESNTSTNLESQILFGDSRLDETKTIKVHTAAPCEESCVFTSLEREQLLVNSEPQSDGKEERNEMEFKNEFAFFNRLESGLVLGESGQDRLDIDKSYFSQHQNHHSSSPKFGLKDDNMVRESHVAALGFRDNIIANSSGSMASKVSYNHEFNVEQETAGAELMKNGSQAMDVESLDATQGESKKNSGHSLHVDSVNLFGIHIEEAETIMEAERNVSCSSDVIAGACSMVSEESGSSTVLQNQIHDALEELTITDNNETNELIEAKVTNNIEKGNEGNLLLNSSDGTEDEHLGFDSEVDFGNTRENPEFLEDEAADSTATAFGKAIALTSDELTVQNNMNEKAADEEMIRRETTENKEYLNIDESGTSSEKQVRREPILVYRTQVKPKRHDMKENAPNSKIVDNLNVTAPRTSKRQPLKDLRKN